MHTFETFEKEYIKIKKGASHTKARQKYIAALDRYGKIATESLAFGTMGVGAGAGAGAGEEADAPTKSRFTPDQADEFGFVYAINLKECDMTDELRQYIPPGDVIDYLMSQVRVWTGGMIDVWRKIRNKEKTKEYEAIDMFTEFASRILPEIQGYLDSPADERLAAAKGRDDYGIEIPVYIRDACVEKEMTLCVPRPYYYFGMCGLFDQPMNMYLGMTPIFRGHFPYSVIESNQFTAFETIIWSFLSDDYFTVATYTISESGGHHARFAIKDTQNGILYLFDPHGSITADETRTPDVDIFRRVVRRMQDGIEVNVLEIKESTVKVGFFGFETYEYLNVSFDQLFADADADDPVPRDQIVVDQTFILRVDSSSIQKVRLNNRSRPLPYRGDQTFEGSCMVMACMRASYVAMRHNMNPGSNPIDYVDEDIPCHFAAFIATLASSFETEEGKFSRGYLKEEQRRNGGIFVTMMSTSGREKSIWVENILSFQTIHAIKIVYRALRRAYHIGWIDSSSLNPYNYRFYIKYYNTKKLGKNRRRRVYYPMDGQPIRDLSCTQTATQSTSADADSCEVVVERLGDKMWNVTIGSKSLDLNTTPLENFHEFILSEEQIRTQTVGAFLQSDALKAVCPDRYLQRRFMYKNNRRVSDDSYLDQVIELFSLPRPIPYVVFKNTRIALTTFDDEGNEQYFDTNIDESQTVADVIEQVLRENPTTIRPSPTGYVLAIQKSLNPDTLIYDLETKREFYLVPKITDEFRLHVHYIPHKTFHIPINESTTFGDLKERLPGSSKVTNPSNVRDSNTIFPTFHTMTIQIE